jgi:hypothetical protein
MERTDESVEAYLATHDVDGSLHRLDEVITECLPREPRVVWRGRMWGGTDQAIIGYGDLVQSRPRGPDLEWFLIGLARQRRHLSLYVNAVENGQPLGARFGSRLGRVKVGSSSLTFASADDIDLDGLRDLAREAATHLG